MIRPRVRLGPRVRGRVKNTENLQKCRVGPTVLSRAICGDVRNYILLRSCSFLVFVTKRPSCVQDRAVHRVRVYHRTVVRCRLQSVLHQSDGRRRRRRVPADDPPHVPRTATTKRRNGHGQYSVPVAVLFFCGATMEAVTGMLIHSTALRSVTARPSTHLQCDAVLCL